MSSTIFEKSWQNPDSPFLYKNEEAGVGILADVFPKFPDQVVLIPRDGMPKNNNASMSDLDLKTQMGISCLISCMDEKMSIFSGVPEARAITHIEGFAVPNHPHVVMFPALRGESIDFFKPSRHTDEEVRQMLVARTLKNLALTKEEKNGLDEEIQRILDI